ncbi:NAD-dependent succinate-semialdehyde dehydrogenase [Weissella minor]|uniref:NAD-dependent succinate-semialdehyde dehydrogenase n=1 Tax=Weissella minor TaxID=1620 RepID=UPI001BB0CE34|nr:NAD-dependent succinate-semialdehyde dehydrogenase [Weissella minor]MBS0949095.1 NAD-dependent succinate-semialdehyde dehydrogenase [Weissella minor]
MAYASTNPFNNEVLKRYDNTSDEAIETAIAQGHHLYQTWRNDDVSSRSRKLNDLADYFTEHIDDLARVMTLEMGKLIGEAKEEIALSAHIAHYYANNADDMLKPKPITTAIGSAEVIYRPTGVIMSVEPWNFPFYQIIRVFAPNYMAGNPVILKHASITPGSGLAFEQAVHAVGMPTGSFKNIFATHEQLEHILADKRITGLAFTGSEKVGAVIGGEAASNLKKSTLELGGNDPLIVLDDTDLSELNKIIGDSRLANAGQVCVSSKRLIVTEANYATVLDMYKTAFAKIKKVGDPLDPKTQLAPLSSVKAKRRLVKQVNAALENGATLAFGTLDTDENTAHFMPIILTNVTEDNPAFKEEFFGPVGMVFEVADEHAAIDLANNSNYGLSGIVFAGDADHGAEVAAQLETGSVYVNYFNDTLPELPFGGVKNSGYGRELGDEGIKEFMNHELIVKRTKPIA